MILLDTNILARMTDARHPHCAAARQAITRLKARKESLVVVPQNLFEFWAVATRAANPPPQGENGLGMTPNAAHLWLLYFRRQFPILADQADLVDRWQKLVRDFAIKGYRSHDARLAAAMQSHGIAEILTFNAGDFKKLGVTVIDPATV